MKMLVIPEKRVSVSETVDVIVAGGGPAGLGAAVSAARTGASVLLLEKRGFLGGNITAAFVETCNWFLHNTKFSAQGLYREIESAYRKEYGSSHDVRENAPHRFSSEYLKIFLDEFIAQEHIRVLFHSFVNDVVIHNNHIDGVIIQTKKGPMAVSGTVIIDATGDGDLAAAAGVPYRQGRDTDGYCQPGTLNFRIAGVDVQTLAGEGDLLKKIGKQFEQDYLAGKTGLACKRKDLPFGRLTQAGILSYINYPCEYMIDPTSNIGLTQGETACRRYIKEMYRYMKAHFPGFERIEIAAIAPEIGFRDSRRMQGKYVLTHEDIEARKTFDDVICLFPRMYDMLAPDGNMRGDGALEGGGYKGHIFVHIKPEDTRTFEVPYRCLLPESVDNLLVAGRCISTTHVAESSIRAIYACMLTGQAAGTAAGFAARDSCTPEEVSIGKLQESLKKQGVL
jgi:ribulose 1,5-bisphosphate synthetase/thiazole synthase